MIRDRIKAIRDWIQMIGDGIKAIRAESNLPLVIDQPEDDLDDALIFSSVVKTLRTIKERRQVILVTHNANIAVLGDSELSFRCAVLNIVVRCSSAVQ